MLFTNNLAISPGLPGGSDSKESACIADDIILYIENSKDNTRKLQGIINECSKVAGYKINTHKSSEKGSSDSISILSSVQAREAISKLCKTMP